MLTYKHTNLFSEITAGIVIFFSCIVVIGWILDIHVLKSIHPSWVTMKFSTAISFLLSAFILISITRCNDRCDFFRAIVLPMSTMTLLLMVSTLLLGIAFNINTGIELLFVSEAVEEILSAKPGLPSIGTMIGFMAIGIVGFMGIICTVHIQIALRIIGSLVICVGLIAISEFITGLPWLFFYVENLSTGMALHTALLFICLGMGFLGVKMRKNSFPRIAFHTS